MNRIIKFRGKSVLNDEWIYGDLVHRINIPKTISPVQINGIGVKEDTVGQFTGLYDKNGKEVYEGDILFIGNNGDKNIYNEVSIKDGCFGYIGEWSHKIMPFCYYNVTEEIAGNIYDNPELIKEE
ncbi:YopX family protein [Bacteroides faecis]|jgi:hypothetical protein|uniref:YopX family protein n=1 Tax=Bacteroides faecis TaxID=674529 RepID=UPI00356A32CA